MYRKHPKHILNRFSFLAKLFLLTYPILPPKRLGFQGFRSVKPLRSRVE